MCAIDVHVTRNELDEDGYWIALRFVDAHVLKVAKNKQQISDLLGKLKSDFPQLAIGGEKVTERVEPEGEQQSLHVSNYDVKDLERIFSSLFQFLGSEWWNYLPVASFFDEHFHESSLIRICLKHYQFAEQKLHEKLMIQERQLAAMEGTAKSMLETISEVTREFHYLQGQNPGLGAAFQALQNSLTSLLSQSSTSPQSRSTAGEVVSSISTASDSFHLQHSAGISVNRPLLSAESMNLFAPPPSQPVEIQAPPQSQPPLQPTNVLGGGGVSSSPSYQVAETQSVSSRESPAQVSQSPIERTSNSYSNQVFAPSFPSDPLPEDWRLPFAETMDEFMIGLIPHETQIQYRMSALALLKREIRAVLGVVAYDVGLFAIRCSLSEDPIKITVIVNPTQLAWWHTTLSEKLNLFIENPAELHRLISEPGDLISEELKIIMTHTLRNIICCHDKSQYKIACVMDSLEVEITANNRYELCTLMFLEEFSLLIGNNHLFKKSLLLIRSWWINEATAITGGGNDIKNCLNEYAIAFMVVGIFNQYAHLIHHPMIALCYFLRDYSQLDVYHQVISIQGITTFESPSTTGITDANNNQPKLIPPSNTHVINHEMMERYWKLFNLNDPLNIEPPSGVPKPQLDAMTRYEMLKISMYRACTRFERKGFDIIHPFLISNMSATSSSTTPAGASDALSNNRRVSLIQKAFVTGYQTLTEALKQIHAGQLTLNEFPRRFFSSTYLKVKGQWRHDAVNNAVPVPSAGDFSWSSASKWLGLENGVNRFMQFIHYCNFTADAILSESALITFCIDLLLIRGPLPAGEVGKILSEASSVQNLSHRLREKYGGLKKFLEKFPDLFVFSNDHPFNPHILLRQTISHENLDLIDRGIFPLHLLSKAARPTISYANLPRKPPSKTAESMMTGPSPSSIYGSAGVPSNPVGGYNQPLTTSRFGSSAVGGGGIPTTRLGSTYDYAGQGSPSTSSLNTYESRAPVSYSSGGVTRPGGSVLSQTSGYTSTGYSDHDYRSYGDRGGGGGSSGSYRTAPDSSTYNSYQRPPTSHEFTRSEVRMPPTNEYGYETVQQRGKYSSAHGGSSYPLSSYDNAASERVPSSYYSESRGFGGGSSTYSTGGGAINLPDSSYPGSSYGESRGSTYSTNPTGATRYDSSALGSNLGNQSLSRVVGSNASNPYSSSSIGYSTYADESFTNPASGIPPSSKPTTGSNDASSYSSYFNRDSSNYSQF